MNDELALRPTVLSICTGGGGLDLGFRLAVPAARTVCYVEREAFAVALLEAAMEHGFMDEAPVWSDLRTFDGTAWRGVVDWLIGGIPCQPHSGAGLRRGVDDERDLWPDAARIIGEVRPSVVFLENVPGIVRYYHECIGPDLRAMGYRTEEGLFSAVEIGAPHVRQRFFVLAYAERRAAERPGRELAGASSSVEGEAREQRIRADAEHGEHALAYSQRSERRTHGGARGAEGPDVHEQGWKEGSGRAGVGNETVAHPRGVSRAVCLCGRRSGQAGCEIGRQCTRMAESDGGGRGTFEHRVQAWQSDAGGRGESTMADSTGDGWDQGSDHQTRERRFEPASDSADVGNADRERLQGCQCGQCTNEQAPGASSTRFPPGPDDLEGWARVLAEVPAFEPALCNVADGLAASGDRSHRLRLLGNGVVPLVAAHALLTLTARTLRAP